MIGLFNTNFFVPDQAKHSFAGQIMRYAPAGTAPLFGMSSMMKSETAVNTEHGYYAKTLLFPQVTSGGSSQGAGVTDLTVVSTANMLPGMILQVSTTSENIIVNSVNSPTVMNVTRGVGTVSAAAIPANTPIYQIGNAYEEGSTRPNALATLPVRVTNLTQIFRNTWALTDTARAVVTIPEAGEAPVAENRQECAFFHAADIEKSLFFGQKFEGSRNGQPFRTMDGLIAITGNISYYPSSYSVPNVFTAGSTTTYEQLEGYLDGVFNQVTNPQVGNERVLFVGKDAFKVINGIGRLAGMYQIIDGQTTFGLQFSTFKIARGTFRMIEHPLFNTNPTWSKMAIAVDMSTFALAYLGDRKTKRHDFGMDERGNTWAENGWDAVGGTLTTELTLVIKNPPANAVIKNLTAAAASS